VYNIYTKYGVSLDDMSMYKHKKQVYNRIMERR